MLDVFFAWFTRLSECKVGREEEDYGGSVTAPREGWLDGYARSYAYGRLRRQRYWSFRGGLGVVWHCGWCRQGGLNAR